MNTIRASTTVWLILDDGLAPRWVIVYTPAVHKVTGETHMMYRVDRWHLEPKARKAEAWHDELQAAIAWCREVVDRPKFNAPMRGPDGGVVTVEEQKERWEAGQDLRTGRPLTTHE